MTSMAIPELSAKFQSKLYSNNCVTEVAYASILQHSVWPWNLSEIPTHINICANLSFIETLS